MYTGSRKAKKVLDEWESLLPKFEKVMPVDYKRVLAERKKAKAKEAGAQDGQGVKRDLAASQDNGFNLLRPGASLPAGWVSENGGRIRPACAFTN